MLYNPPSGSSDANAPYVGKNTAGGTQGSKVPPAAVEYPQRELVALIAASGQSPTNTVLTQAAIALSRGIWVGALTGSGDLAVATLGLVLPSLLQGMRIGAVATATNTTTTPKLRVVNLNSPGGIVDFPIIKEDGSALAAGEIKAGRRYCYESNGAGSVLISGGGIGASTAQITNYIGSNKIPFNERVLTTSQRVSMSLPANSAGVFAVGASGLQFPKISQSSRLVISGSFSCFSPIVVGNGAGAVTMRMRATSGGTVLYDEAPVVTGFYIGSTSAPCSIGASPTFVIDGLPAGPLTLDLLFKRDDNGPWTTVMNANSTDVSGLPAINTGKFIVKEEEI